MIWIIVICVAIVSYYTYIHIQELNERIAFQYNLLISASHMTQKLLEENNALKKKLQKIELV